MGIESLDIARLRLKSQHLTETCFTTAGDMVSYFGAVQGQEYAQTKWGLGLRLPHLVDEDIEKELSTGRILRTHMLRPTWHFVAAADIRWLLKLTALRVKAVNAYMQRKLELDDEIFNKCNDIIISLLVGGKQITRDEIGLALIENGIEAKGHRLSYIMMQAELDGIVCSGARKGNQFTYALLEDRVPKGNIPDREEALAGLAKRYFFSRGPATIMDFSAWSGLTISDCRMAVNLSRSFFQKLSLGNTDYYCPAECSLVAEPFQGILLLPVYDEFIMGYKDRSAILEYKYSTKSNLQLPFDNTIVADGQIIGSWRRKLSNKAVYLEFDLFSKLNSLQKVELEKAISRFGEFNKLAVNVGPYKIKSRLGFG
jgi:hypothetical protein